MGRNNNSEEVRLELPSGRGFSRNKKAGGSGDIFDEAKEVEAPVHSNSGGRSSMGQGMITLDGKQAFGISGEDDKEFFPGETISGSTRVECWESSNPAPVNIDSGANERDNAFGFAAASSEDKEEIERRNEEDRQREREIIPPETEQEEKKEEELPKEFEEMEPEKKPQEEKKEEELPKEAEEVEPEKKPQEEEQHEVETKPATEAEKKASEKEKEEETRDKAELVVEQPLNADFASNNYWEANTMYKVEDLEEEYK